MPRYIDADALKQGVGSYSPVKYTYEYGLVITVEDIDSAPTADVVERKKGKWRYYAVGGYHCTECQCRAPYYCLATQKLSQFCPDCGAEMSIEEEEDAEVH